jgi:hypothetical protein
MIQRDGKIVLQFFVDSAGLIPASAVNINDGYKSADWSDRNYEIGPVGNCCIEDLPDELLSSGWMFQGAFWQMRFGKTGEPFYVVKFPFTMMASHISDDPKDSDNRNKALTDLQEMADGALWKTWKYAGSQAVNFGSRILRADAKVEHYLYLLNRRMNIIAA